MEPDNEYDIWSHEHADGLNNNWYDTVTDIYINKK